MTLRRGRRLPDLGDRVADLLGEVELGAGEALRRVLEHPLGARVGRGDVADELRPLDRDGHDARLVQAEHHAPLHGRGRVVEVDDRALAAVQRLEGAADERLAGLGEHLHGHVVRDAALLDQHADEVVVGLRGGREADLDLLVAHRHQQVEHPELALGVHGLDQRLVAVAQVHAAPDGRAGERAGGPAPVGKGDRREGRVLLHGVDGHGWAGAGSLPRMRRTHRDRPRLPGRRGHCSNWGEGVVSCARGTAAAGREAARAQPGAQPGTFGDGAEDAAHDR